MNGRKARARRTWGPGPHGLVKPADMVAILNSHGYGAAMSRALAETAAEVLRAQGATEITVAGVVGTKGAPYAPEGGCFAVCFRCSQPDCGEMHVMYNDLHFAQMFAVTAELLFPGEILTFGDMLERLHIPTPPEMAG